MKFKQCAAMLLLSVAPNAFATSAFAPMPEAVSNNAITQVSVNNKDYIISFSGLNSKKDHHGVHNKTFIFDVQSNQWKIGASVPMKQAIFDTGSQSKTPLTGRLASVATSINGLAYVFGGYTVASDHSEVSVPDVYSYHVVKNTYESLPPMPVPVDDSVALTYQNRYIYLVSGWHNDGNVNLVQLFDTKTRQWSQASPFPGKPVFGQAGAMLGNKMLICDGVKVDYHTDKRRSYSAEPACYLGTVDTNRPNFIDWRVIKHPTGIARYRMAATHDNANNALVFIGGSDNPYNYSGIGYNGSPAEPDNKIWRFNLEDNAWHISTSESHTMDHRGLINLSGQWLTVGGMGKNQEVLNTITIHKTKG